MNDETTPQQPDNNDSNELYQNFLESLSKRVSRIKHNQFVKKMHDNNTKTKPCVENEAEQLSMIRNKMQSNARACEIVTISIYILNQREGYIKEHWKDLPDSFCNAFNLIRSLLGLEASVFNLTHQQTLITVSAMIHIINTDLNEARSHL